MNICVLLNGLRHPDSIATSDEWQILGSWVEETADVTLPLTQIWHLTYLLTYGWENDLPALARELRRLKKQQTIPVPAQAVLTNLARIVDRRTKEIEQIEIIYQAEGVPSSRVDWGKFSSPPDRSFAY